MAKSIKKKQIFHIVAGCMLFAALAAGGIYYVLTRYYLYNIHNLHAKNEMMWHLDYWYGKPFELLSTEFETAEKDTGKIRYSVPVWIYTLEDENGEQFQTYLWINSMAAGSCNPDDYTYQISDTYVEAGTENFIYEIDQDGENYRVSVYDRQEKLLYEDFYPREPVVKRIGKDTLEIHEGAGNTWWSVFINGETGEVSKPIADVIACNEQTAVYPVFEDGVFKIIIRDIYNENAYEEIIDDFPPMATGTGFIKEAKVLDSYTVYLDYYTGDSGNGDEWEEKRIVVKPCLEDKTVIRIAGWDVEYIISDRSLGTEDFEDLELGSSLDDIEKKLGKPDGWVGSGILRPFYVLENKSAVELVFNNATANEDLAAIYLYKEDEEIVLKSKLPNS